MKRVDEVRIETGVSSAEDWEEAVRACYRTRQASRLVREVAGMRSSGHVPSQEALEAELYALPALGRHKDAVRAFYAFASPTAPALAHAIRAVAASASPSALLGRDAFTEAHRMVEHARSLSVEPTLPVVEAGLELLAAAGCPRGCADVLDRAFALRLRHQHTASWQGRLFALEEGGGASSFARLLSLPPDTPLSRECVAHTARAATRFLALGEPDPATARAVGQFAAWLPSLLSQPGTSFSASRALHASVSSGALSGGDRIGRDPDTLACVAASMQALARSGDHGAVLSLASQWRLLPALEAAGQQQQTVQGPALGLAWGTPPPPPVEAVEGTPTAASSAAPLSSDAAKGVAAGHAWAQALRGAVEAAGTEEELAVLEREACRQEGAAAVAAALGALQRVPLSAEGALPPSMVAQVACEAAASGWLDPAVAAALPPCAAALGGTRGVATVLHALGRGSEGQFALDHDSEVGTRLVEAAVSVEWGRGDAKAADERHQSLGCLQVVEASLASRQVSPGSEEWVRLHAAAATAAARMREPLRALRWIKDAVAAPKNAAAQRGRGRGRGKGKGKKSRGGAGRARIGPTTGPALRGAAHEALAACASVGDAACAGEVARVVRRLHLMGPGTQCALVASLSLSGAVDGAEQAAEELWASVGGRAGAALAVPDTGAGHVRGGRPSPGEARALVLQAAALDAGDAEGAAAAVRCAAVWAVRAHAEAIQAPRRVTYTTPHAADSPPRGRRGERRDPFPVVTAAGEELCEEGPGQRIDRVGKVEAILQRMEARGAASLPAYRAAAEALGRLRAPEQATRLLHDLRRGSRGAGLWPRPPSSSRSLEGLWAKGDALALSTQAAAAAVQSSPPRSARCAAPDASTPAAEVVVACAWAALHGGRPPLALATLELLDEGACPQRRPSDALTHSLSSDGLGRNASALGAQLSALATLGRWSDAEKAASAAQSIALDMRHYDPVIAVRAAARAGNGSLLFVANETLLTHSRPCPGWLRQALDAAGETARADTWLARAAEAGVLSDAASSPSAVHGVIDLHAFSVALARATTRRALQGLEKRFMEAEGQVRGAFFPRSCRPVARPSLTR